MRRTKASEGRSLRIAVATALCLGPTVFAAPSALAHDQLTASTPQPDEQLTTPPPKITLTFSGTLLSLDGQGYDILLDGPCGSTCFPPSPTNPNEATKAQLDGEKISREVTMLPQGQYDVKWRVISSDGHPISGIYRFAVGEPVSTEESLPRPDNPRPPGHESAEDSVSLSWVLWPALGAGLSLLGYLMYVILTSRKRRDRPQ